VVPHRRSRQAPDRREMVHQRIGDYDEFRSNATVFAGRAWLAGLDPPSWPGS